jgi:hypothetical protein
MSQFSIIRIVTIVINCMVSISEFNDNLLEDFDEDDNNELYRSTLSDKQDEINDLLALIHSSFFKWFISIVICLDAVSIDYPIKYLIIHYRLVSRLHQNIVHQMILNLLFIISLF